VGRERRRISMPSKPLNQSQKLVLESTKAFADRNGYSPTVREIADDLHYSTSTIYKNLMKLKAKGYISMTEHKTRTIKIIRQEE
jgi:SOS-response transcriptional repressor LexA